jgi:hypothetical protein
MYSLSARNYFFSTTKHIVRIRVFRIGRIRHCVEWANLKGELVKDICFRLDLDGSDLTEISVILVFNKFSQELFLWSPDQVRKRSFCEGYPMSA